MFRSSASLPAGARPDAAEAAARSKFADRFCIGVRDACTADQRREAERRASLPLGLEAAAP
jgi:hypothetical protein